MENRVQVAVALKEAGKDGDNTIFINEKVKLEDTETVVVYQEYAKPQTGEGTYGKYKIKGILAFQDVEYPVYEKTPQSGNGTYDSATIKRDECYATIRKKQPLSYKYSSDPEKQKMFTMEVSFAFEEGLFAGSKSEVEDKPF